MFIFRNEVGMKHFKCTCTVKALTLKLFVPFFFFLFFQIFPPTKTKSAKEEEGVAPQEEQHHSLPSCHCYSLRAQYCQGPWIGHYCQKRTAAPVRAQGGAKAQTSRGQENL